MALAATSSTLTFANGAAAAQTSTVSGGTQPYSIIGAPNAAIATASIVPSTGVVTVTPVAGAAGVTTVIVDDSVVGAPITITVQVGTQVKVNTRIVSPSLGVIQSDNATYWDPATKINLTRGNPLSKDLSGFTNLQLANIANAVKSGILTLLCGTLPAATESFNLYSTIFKPGVAGGDSSTGITSVAAADALENNF